MKIISKSERMNTITIEVNEEFVNDVMEVVKIINTDLCNHYKLKYEKNLFINFDELVENQLWFGLTYLREFAIEEIIEEKKSYMDDIFLIG